MVTMTLETQKQLMECKPFIGSMYYDSMSYGQHLENQLFLMEDLGDGIYSVLTYLDSRVKLKICGFFVPQKDLFAFPDPLIEMEKYVIADKSFVSVTEEKLDFLTKDTSRLFLDKIIETLFFPDGSINEDEIDSILPDTLPKADKMQSMICASKMFMNPIFSEKLGQNQFYEWMKYVCNNNESEKMSENLRKIEIPMERIAKYLLLGKPTYELYQIMKNICGPDFISTLYKIAAEYRMAVRSIRSTEKKFPHNQKMAMDIMNEIDKTCEASESSLNIRITMKQPKDKQIKIDGFYRWSQMLISPMGICHLNRASGCSFFEWGNISMIKVGNKIVYRR